MLRRRKLKIRYIIRGILSLIIGVFMLVSLLPSYQVLATLKDSVFFDSEIRTLYYIVFASMLTGGALTVLGGVLCALGIFERKKKESV